VNIHHIGSNANEPNKTDAKKIPFKEIKKNKTKDRREDRF